MSYLNRVELWRERNRQTEERHKAHKRQASESGQKESGFTPAPLAMGEKSFLRHMWDKMTSHLSRKTLKEREEAAKKAEAEKAKA